MTDTSDTRTIDLLRRLTLAPGAPGAEEPVGDVVRKAVEDVDGLDVTTDSLGSLILTRKGGAERPRVLLDAHLDEVGFMVQNISEEGLISFVPLGGWWAHVLLAQRVDVITRGGAVPGVIGSKPPHFLGARERDRVMKIEWMHIDIGARSRQEVERLGVDIGDPIVPHAEFLPLANPRILSSKAFDDRAGVGVLVETLRALSRSGHPNTVIGVGAVQEEVGCRGAATAVQIARPDVAIVLEGTPADDLPGFAPATQQGALGKGPQIRFADPSAISHRGLVRFVRDVASDLDIAVQIAVRRSGGTDAKAIHVHARGVPTVVVGVPARYIHTNVSLIDLDDFIASRNLVVEVVRRLDEGTVTALGAMTM